MRCRRKYPPISPACWPATHGPMCAGVVMPHKCSPKDVLLARMAALCTVHMSAQCMCSSMLSHHGCREHCASSHNQRQRLALKLDARTRPESSKNTYVCASARSARTLSPSCCSVSVLAVMAAAAAAAAPLPRLDVLYSTQLSARTIVVHSPNRTNQADRDRAFDMVVRRKKAVDAVGTKSARIALAAGGTGL